MKLVTIAVIFSVLWFALASWLSTGIEGHRELFFMAYMAGILVNGIVQIILEW